MRLDTLRNRAVVDPESGSRLGTVTDYWIDATLGRVAALMIRPVDADLPQRIAAERVARVGRDAVMLSRARTSGASTGATLPVAVTAEWLNHRHVTGLTVYTDTGERLGQVAGAEIDPVTLIVQNYDLTSRPWQRWRSGRQHISAANVAWCGRDVLVVRTDDPVKLRPAGHENGAYEAPGRERVKAT